MRSRQTLYAILGIISVAAALPRFPYEQALTQFLEVETRVSADPSKDTKTPKDDGFRALNGRIKLNGRTYQTSCQCSDSSNTKFCNAPFRLHIHQEQTHRELGLTIPDIRRLLGRPTDFKLVSAQHSSFSDTDGRQTKESLCTPGGDFGEMLNAMSVYERLTRMKMTRQVVENTLRSYLAVGPAFFFATDEDALKRLSKKIGNEALSIATLPQGKQKEALDKLVMPGYNGSPFVQSVLVTPRAYHTSARLAGDLIRAVFNILWDTKSPGPHGLLRDSINLVIYEGESKPKAWVNFINNHPCADEGRASPFAALKVNSTSISPNHPEAVVNMRQALARFFLTRSPPVTETMRGLVGMLNRQGLRIMEQFASSQGPVPFYSVVVE